MSKRHVVVKDDKGREVFSKELSFDGEERLVREIFEKLSQKLRKRFTVDVVSVDVKRREETYEFWDDEELEDEQQ